jgi:hypothetical protein
MVYGTAESEFLIVYNSVMGLLKKDGEVKLARSCKKRSVAKSEGRQGYPACNTKKGGQMDWSHLA